MRPTLVLRSNMLKSALSARHLQLVGQSDSRHHHILTTRLHAEGAWLHANDGYTGSVHHLHNDAIQLGHIFESILDLRTNRTLKMPDPCMKSIG